jgi:exonuclease III
MTNDASRHQPASSVVRRKQSESSILFLTYNILDGGRGREKELEDIIAAQNADVVLLQEVMDVEFITRLAARLKTECYVAGSNSGARLALLSRLPIIRAASFHPAVLRHTCVEAVVGYAPDKTLKVVGVHLAAPAFTLPIEIYRLRELNVILKRIRESVAERVVVAGDFNSIAPGDRLELAGLPVRVRLAVFLQGGYLARQVIGKMRSQGFTDVFRNLNPQERGYTFPASQPDARFDYFFVNDALRQNLRACYVVVNPPNVQAASDHLPVALEMDW